MAVLTAPNGYYNDAMRPVYLFDVASQAVPSIMTSAIGVDCRLIKPRIINPSGGSSRTITVQDGNGNLIDFATLNGGGVLLILDHRPGELCPGGIQWQASGSGLIGSIRAEPNYPQ